MASIQLTAPNGTAYTQPTGLFINNEFVSATSGEKIETINPYDGSVICAVDAASEADVDSAVAAARAAFKAASWRKLPASDRGSLLYKLAELCERDSHILATIDAWDNGKPYQAALEEDVADIVSVFKYYAGWADKTHGQAIETSETKLAYTRHEPIGVCGQIIPWNYPIMMAGWKLAPALATGNTIVLKAAEQTPLSILYLAGLIRESGFPPGVVNIINGWGRVAGASLAGHSGVDKIAFTGSTTTGKAIMRAAANNLKNITLETGGKSPLIVFADADLDQAVKWSHVGIMSNMGQICTSTSRIYVPRFVEYTKENSIVGNPFDSNVTHGPQVSKLQQEKILSYVETTKKEGARLLHGGDSPSGQGYFVNPTIFADVRDDMTAVREEIFGPFVVIQSFKTEEEVVEKANDSEYGLGAAIFTQDITRGHTISAAIEAGMVWINSSQDCHFGIPFGGVKQSGIGRELGQYALSAYTQVKAVHVADTANGETPSVSRRSARQPKEGLINCGGGVASHYLFEFHTAVIIASRNPQASSMGGAEVYCAICGGPVSVPFWEDGDEEEYTYDLTVVQEDRLDLEWLKDVRVIGEDPASTGLSRIWVSGVASHDEHGYFYLEEGDPVMELFGEESLRTYAYKGHHSFALPYHQTCRTLLSKYLNVGSDDTENDGSDGIDNDMFFQVLRQLADTSEYAQALKLDYGSVSKNQEQYWCVSRGDEHFVHSPLDIPRLERYLVRIPWMEHERPMHYALPRGQYDASDPISTLPMELRWSILLHLDMPSLMYLFQTCRALYATQRSSSWWRRKLLADMPWLFEVSSIEAVVTEEWARVYKDMWLASRYTPSAHKITGLANRRRIWEEILPQIAGPYEKLQKESARTDLPDILKGASSTGLRRLISPEPEVNSSFRYYFAQSIAGLRDAHIEFHVHLDQEQFIRGLHFAEGPQRSEQSAPTQDAFDFPTTVESVQVPANDYLTGIIVTSREIPEGEERSRKIVGLEFLLGSSTSQQVGSTDGDRRLIHVSKDHFAVGIETFSSSEGGLSRLSLLQQPALLSRGIDRFSSQGSTLDHVNLEAAKYLWRKQIPPPGVQISEHHSGYWSYAMEKDLSPMEPLIFGTTDAELADITAISIDVLFGGIEVRYGSRPSRSIGPRNLAMKTLAIDGQGGERVVALKYVVTYIPMGIRIVTNYGRQLVVGQTSRRQEELMQYPHQDPDTRQFTHLVGMYGYWSSRDTPKSRLEAVGCLFAAELGGQHQGATEMPELASGQSPLWEPSAPSGVREVGPILGDFSVKQSLGINSRTLEVLDHCPTVSWIDCSRPLLEVRVTLCHSFEERQVPLSAITFKYADGAKEEVNIGPEIHPQSPIDTQGDGNDWCWCTLSGRKTKDELSVHPHYKQHVWELRDKRLQSVRVFLSPIDEEVGRGSRLAGIQFIAEDGSESPKWSHWNFSSDDGYVIESIAFTDERIGLKLFMGETRRSVTYEDTIVYALQAMERLV